jgi:hypothetical protein
MTVTWDGSTVDSLTNLTNAAWVQHSFTETATSSSTTIAFTVNDSPRYLALDDVSVTAVPEPAGLVALSGIGAMGLLGIVWRGRKQIAPSATAICKEERAIC